MANFHSCTDFYADASGLRKFLEETSQAVGGLLLHRGSEIRWLDERILAVDAAYGSIKKSGVRDPILKVQ